MTINGLGQFDMMSAYNRIDRISKASEAVVNAPVDQASKTPEVQKVQTPEVKIDENSNDNNSSGLKINLNLDGIRSKSNASLEDISRDFSKRDNFVISPLDTDAMEKEMAKAVNAMEQDSSLRQYQYFVGDNNNFIVNDEDGIVVMK